MAAESAPPPPDLPGYLLDDDSLLTKKYGKEVFNYFGWSSLNRVSFLRTDHAFLTAAVSHEDAKFLVLNDFAPLMSSASKKVLHSAKHSDVISLTGPNPFQQNEQEMIDAYDSTIDRPVLVFLGIQESKTARFQYRSYKGEPYFVVDVTPRGSYAEAANAVISSLTSGDGYFNEGMRNTTLSQAAGRSPPTLGFS
jgi:NAD+ diphosphatase